MDIRPPTTKPPFTCIFCGQTEAFSSEEHIVPHSLGNDMLVLAPGWVCDRCNNICSGFESKALNNSILGVERCRLGVVTKRKRPARSDVHGISWFSEPGGPHNVVSAEARWNRIPTLLSPGGSSGKIVFPFHDDSCYAIARLLLKIGVEIMAPSLEKRPRDFNRFRIVGRTAGGRIRTNKMRSAYEGPHGIGTAFAFYQHGAVMKGEKSKLLVNMGSVMPARPGFIPLMPLLRSNPKVFDLVS